VYGVFKSHALTDKLPTAKNPRKAAVFYHKSSFSFQFHDHLAGIAACQVVFEGVVDKVVIAVAR
jgi:hypothetical protein